MGNTNGIDTTPSDVAMASIEALPFGDIIGGPLKACIEAQSNAAMATWNFIQNVGMVKSENDKDVPKLAYVSFSYRRQGRSATINVPLLTIVPIPYIAIRDIDISFKAKISATSSSSYTQQNSQKFDFGMSVGASVNFLLAKASTEMNVGFSSKKDSKATRDSKYSVEYTMDVAVKAGQEDMPAGMAKILEMLNESIDVVEGGGELHVSSNYVKLSDSETLNGTYVTFKNNEGFFDSNLESIQFKVSLWKDNKKVDAVKGVHYDVVPDNLGIACIFRTPGQYVIHAGDKTAIVNVVE